MDLNKKVKTSMQCLALSIIGWIMIVAQVCWAQDQEKIYPKREYRAVWLTTIYQLDWPHSSSAIAQQQELDRLLDQLQEININTIFIQVRGRGDLIYPNDYEPVMPSFRKAIEGTSTYDPLAYTIKACHERGMECHAWLVMLPLGNYNYAKSLGSKSFLFRHQSATVKYRGHYFMNPCHPETRHHLGAVVKDLVERYKIDGIHLDYIRYPEFSEHYPDKVAYRRTRTKLSLEDWRRNNINELVSYISQTIRKSKNPDIALSAAPIGKYSRRDGRRKYKDEWTARESVFQDPQNWINNKYVSFVAPMMYYEGDDFFAHLGEWKKVIDSDKVIVGLGAYKVEEKPKQWNPNVISQQIDSLRTLSFSGFAFFRAQHILNNNLGLHENLLRSSLSHPSLLFPKENGVQPQNTPTIENLYVANDSILLNISYNGADKDQVSYNIYISNNGMAPDSQTGKNLYRVGYKKNRLTIPKKEFLRQDSLLWVEVRAYNTDYLESRGTDAVYYNKNLDN